ATTSDNDYVQRSLTSQTIAAGQSSYTFDVTVNGDTTVEADQTFFVNVTNVSGATVGDGQARGTIVNDESAGAIPPTLSSATPIDNATDVAVGSDIVLTFSENVKAGSGNIVLHPATGSDVTIAVTNAQVSFSGNQVTINPTADLRPGVHYDVTMGSGVITDLANNPFAGLSAGALDFTTSFTIPAGTFAPPFTINDPGTFALLAGSTRTQTANTGVQVTATSGVINVDIEGTLNDTAAGQRAIRYNDTGPGGLITIG